MSGNKLTRKEALELITPVVDDEVDEDTRIAFLAYIQNDKYVRNRYESLKRMKTLVSTRCPCASAPDHLKKRIQAYIHEQESGNSKKHEREELIYDMPSDHSVTPDTSKSVINTDKGFWRYAAAASLLAAALVFSIYLYVQSSSPTYNVEEYAYTHFMKHGGQMVQPTISTASLANAELELAHAFDIPLTIPPLKNADFKGVVYTDFVPGFKTPLLEYYLPSEKQYIYIFAFKLNQLKQFEELSRSEEAVRSCINSRDFHIRNVNGKHVVSWKWDDTWYAAISNHQGETLASLVEPLGFSKD